MLVGGAEGSLAKAQYFKGKFIASDLLYVLISKNPNEINYKYAWYYLNFNREKHLLDDTICCGTPKKMISKNRCSNIKIPIPSLERQQEIVKYLDFIYENIKQLEKEIENNKKQAQQFITGIVKAQVQTEEQDDTISVNTESIDEVQNEIVSVEEEEVIIEPKPKVKKIFKKVKKNLVIVEKDNEVNEDNEV
jgi:restriction endonuclease S subunit